MIGRAELLLSSKSLVVQFTYMKTNRGFIWLVLRLLMGWTFLWAFIDKLLGLGFATAPESAWVAGGSPTFGYLTYATKGPFAQWYQALAGSGLVDVLFMAGLLFVGVTLFLGVLVKMGSLAGLLMYVGFYTSGFIPPEHNPVVDEHVINAVIMIGLFLYAPNCRFDLSQYWRRFDLVKRWQILE